jgi:hypothetical protein
MNEQLIERLFIEAQKQITSKTTKDFANKFTELIVRECIERITTYDLVPGHSAKWEDIYDIHARLLQDLGKDLKEHFGVEE